MGKCGKRPSHYPITHPQEHQGQPWQLWTLWAHPFRPLPEKSWRPSTRDHPSSTLVRFCSLQSFLLGFLIRPPGQPCEVGYLYRPHFKDEETKSDA